MIRLREARREDIPVLIPMLLNAFRGRAMNEAFFPEHLRVRPGDEDQVAFRAGGMETRFAARNRELEGDDIHSPKGDDDDDDDGDKIRRRRRRHYIVAVTGRDEDGHAADGADAGAGETVVGYAEWVDGSKKPSLTKEEEEREREREAELKAERIAKMPPSLDREAVEMAQRETVELEKTLKEALGEEGFANSWCESNFFL